MGALLIAAAALICIVAVCYIVFALPAIQAQEDVLRMEMKAQEKDIAEIEETRSGAEQLDANIESMKERIAQREQAMTATPDTIAQSIGEILTSLNIAGTVTKGDNNIVIAASEYVLEIRVQDLNINFSCDRASGETVMQLMEALPDARLAVTGFIFEERDDGAGGAWTVNAKLYYYEEGDNLEATGTDG
jgi:Tfp pilus assembly protein PilN